MTRHKLKEIIYNPVSGNGFKFLVYNQLAQFNNKETETLKIVNKRLDEIPRKRQHIRLNNYKKRPIPRLDIREMCIESTDIHKINWIPLMYTKQTG